MARHLDGVWPPTSLESARQWAQHKATQRPSDDAFFWVIENEAGEVAGSISTHACNRVAGTFAYGVAVREEHQRKGYASEAIRLVLRYFFDELRYQKVTINVHADNPASARLHERLGFQLEGRLRRTVFTHGQLVDELYYGMTAEEFRALNPGG